MVGKPEVVDDLAQEVFSRFLEHIRKGTPIRDAWSFIRAILKNVFLEQLRAKRRSRVMRGIEGGLPDVEVSPPEIDEGQDSVAWIQKLIHDMPDPEKTILVGRYFLGMTVRELSEAVGMSTGSVVYRHDRAIRQLRRHATEQGIRP